MRTTHRLTLALATGPSLLVLALLAVTQVECTHPSPTPANPGGTGGSVVSGTGGSPAPIVYPEPGPVPSGDPTKCAVAARHADDVCPGALSPTAMACARAGGADPGLIPCVMAADGCPALKCDAVSRAARAARAARGP